MDECERLCEAVAAPEGVSVTVVVVVSLWVVDGVSDVVDTALGVPDWLWLAVIDSEALCETEPDADMLRVRVRLGVELGVTLGEPITDCVPVAVEVRA